MNYYLIGRGRTILWEAAANGKASAVNLLLRNGADVNHQDDAGKYFILIYIILAALPL